MTIAILGAVVLGLVSCVSKTVTPGAERIRIFDAEPKGCLYMGEVSSVQENEDTVVTAGKEPEMTLDTRIDLRNKAFKLNGNILVFMSKNKSKMATTHSAIVYVTKKDAKEAPEQKAEEQTEKIPQTVFLGTTFRCPPTILNQ